MKWHMGFRMMTAFLLPALLLAGCKQEKAADNKCVMEIATVPAGANVVVSGESKGHTPLTLRSGRPIQTLLKFELDGYLPTWAAVDFQPGTHQLKVKLTPVSSEVMIISEPSEAQVEYHGRIVGETPLVLRNLPPGSDTATVKKPGFAVREVSWSVNDSRPQEVTVALVSNISTLVVESTPGDAAVYLDDMNCGTTPLTKKIEQGRHRIRVAKSGYADFEEIIICRRGEKITRTITLHEQPGSINVASIPVGALVYVNDVPQKHTPCVIDNLEPGKYTVKIEKSGYEADVQEITITAGKQQDLSVDLGKNTGNVDLVVNPPGVTVYVDGNKVGITEPDENRWISKVFEIKGLKAGAHVITLAHKRAQPEQRVEKVIVKKGQTIRPKPINIWIANAELKHKDGRTMIGCLRDENPLIVIFEPEKGVRQELRRDEIVSLRILKDSE